MTTIPVTEITGVGPSAAALLAEAGFTSAEDVARATPEALSAVRGFGPTRSAQVIAAAQALASAGDPPSGSKPDKPAKAKKRKIKKDKKKKGKGKKDKGKENKKDKKKKTGKKKKKGKK